MPSIARISKEELFNSPTPLPEGGRRTRATPLFIVMTIDRACVVFGEIFQQSGSLGARE